eukprot:10916797-Alexandrium_andersonii.AAC.1
MPAFPYSLLHSEAVNALAVRLATHESLAISTRKPDSQGKTKRKGRSTRKSLAIPAAVGPDGSDSQPVGSDPQ